MPYLKNRKLATISIIYWFLLLYIVAALVWWYISLQQQNVKMSNLLLNELLHEQPDYFTKSSAIIDEKNRKSAQYIGEGTTFLALIIFGAVLVYRMIRKRLKLSQQQQNFMMAVTHELKTPIAVARLNLETIQKRKLEESRQQQLINTTLLEVNRLNSLCNNILLASQLDAGEYKISKNEIDLSNLAGKVANEFAERYTGRLNFSTIEDDIYVTGEPLLLEMLMSNLIENALKYSPKTTPVEVELFRAGHLINFVVKDRGPGIEEKERGKIFDKFYRVGNEVTRTAKGTGLGLYLCRQIARDHQATIHVSDNGAQGATFTVTFKG